jgi:hypothetical protein
MGEVRPYGPAIQEAVASGEVERMRDVLRQAEDHVSQHGDVGAAVEALKVEIAKAEGQARS